MKPFKVFISYCHQDEQYKDQLIAHLTTLKRRGLIQEWHDRMLLPGEDWDGIIKQELLDADIILLLISADFLHSNYCYDIEVTKAVERHNHGDTIVIPIILRPCDWKDLPFSQIHGLPKDAKPISLWPDKDEGYLNIIEGIKSAIKSKDGENKAQESTSAPEGSTQLFPKDLIICRFPRGYLQIDQIEFQEHSTWAVTASYYDYIYGWRRSTHYHSSYHESWGTPDGKDIQCKKLGVPKGDWYLVDSALYLIMEIRERNQKLLIDNLMEHFQTGDDYFDYYPKNTPIPKPACPEKYLILNKTGELRDIIESLTIDSWRDYDLKTLHEEFESIRRDAYLLTYEKLGGTHPASVFLKEIIYEYMPSFNLEDLRLWAHRLSGAISNACKYVK
jgi:hypothetical protein